MEVLKIFRMRDPSPLTLFIDSLNVSALEEWPSLHSDTSFDGLSTQPQPDRSVAVVDGLSLNNSEQLQ